MGDLNRGLSTAVGYALTLAVTVLLVLGLLTAASGLVSDERRQAANGELEVVGDRLAADVLAADRLARATNGGEVRVVSDLPNRVAGLSYRVRVNATAGGATLVLRTSNPETTVRVQLNTQTSVADTDLRGGRFVVRYDADGAGVLEVTDGD